jgi:hypothetical protein
MGRGPFGEQVNFYLSNTYETLYQQALDREMLASLDSGWDLCCCFEGYFVPSGINQLWVWWAVPTRHFAETEAADAGIATIPGGTRVYL